MKTCKDCIYCYEYEAKMEKPFECRLYPQPKQTFSGYWCGQLKEKVHVISDFETDMEQVSYATKALSGKPND